MPYLLGTDEAGYGPNLGPLVVSATLWQIPHGLACADLPAVLGDVIATAAAGATDGRVLLGDSKRLYQPGKGLQHLERGLGAALAALGRRPATWRELMDCVDPAALEQADVDPWHAGYDEPLPIDLDPAALDAAARNFAAGLARANVRLAGLASRVIFPRQFNALVAQFGSKGEALSQTTLGLAAEMLAPLGAEPISVVCDKHGGRNQYQRLLADHFADWLVEIRGESRAASVYRLGPPQRRIEFRFQVGAEAHLPVALASMASKYVRELAMRAWNAFWCQRIAGLKPTAGYPVDARRFKDAIAPLQRELQIADEALWRVR